jgi:hypothetical protein
MAKVASRQAEEAQREARKEKEEKRMELLREKELEREREFQRKELEEERLRLEEEKRIRESYNPWKDPYSVADFPQVTPDSLLIRIRDEQV